MDPTSNAQSSELVSSCWGAGVGRPTLREEMVVGGPCGKTWTRYLAAPGHHLAGRRVAEPSLRNGQLQAATSFNKTIDEVGRSSTALLLRQRAASMDRLSSESRAVGCICC